MKTILPTLLTPLLLFPHITLGQSEDALAAAKEADKAYAQGEVVFYALLIVVLIAVFAWNKKKKKT